MPKAFARVKRSATRSSALQFGAHSGRALAAGVEESVVHDHDMDVLVAATRIELGSRCLATGDYDRIDCSKKTSKSGECSAQDGSLGC